MPINNSLSDFDSIKESIKLQTLDHLENAVNTTEQEMELQSFSEVIKYDKFFIIIDRTTQEIIHQVGIKDWLGYEKEAFSFEKYIRITHQSFVTPSNILSKIASNIAENKHFEVGFRKQQYIVNIGLQHAKGHYLLCKRNSTPWQWKFDNEKVYVTQYCNEFTIIDHHAKHLDINPETLQPRFLDKNNQPLEELEKAFRKDVSQYVETKKQLFTTQEYRILRKMAYEPTLTAAQIAESFKVKVSTIRTLNQRIIEKARLYFNDEFINSTKEVATILRKNYLV